MIGSKSGSFGNQFDNIAELAKALDSYVIIESGDDDLAVAGLAPPMHGQQVAIQYAALIIDRPRTRNRKSARGLNRLASSA